MISIDERTAAWERYAGWFMSSVRNGNIVVQHCDAKGIAEAVAAFAETMVGRLVEFNGKTFGPSPAEAFLTGQARGGQMQILPERYWPECAPNLDTLDLTEPKSYQSGPKGGVFYEDSETGRKVYRNSIGQSESKAYKPGDPISGDDLVRHLKAGGMVLWCGNLLFKYDGRKCPCLCWPLTPDDDWDAPDPLSAMLARDDLTVFDPAELERALAERDGKVAPVAKIGDVLDETGETTHVTAHVKSGGFARSVATGWVYGCQPYSKTFLYCRPYLGGWHTSPCQSGLPFGQYVVCEDPSKAAEG